MLKNLPENMIEKMVMQLKNNDIPTFLMGGGQTAEKILKFMSDRGITIAGVLINRKYWSEDVAFINGYPVYVLEEYLSSNRCNLIVAFSGYHEGQLQNYMSQIQKLYVLDFIGTLCLEGIFCMISHDFFTEHEKDWEWLEAHLDDDKSRKSLEAFLVQRMSGVYTKEEYEKNQYFPEDIIRLQEDEIFVDSGAYCGENSIDFVERLESQQVKGYKRIVCIEADRENVVKLREAMSGYEDVQIISAGTWDRTDTLYLNGGLGVGSRISDEGTDKIQVMAIDDILGGGSATYIKMDVEGAELKSLIGARSTIKTYKPKLAVCIYHKPEDLIEIPRYIYSLRDDYKFYIRNHSPYGIETVLYAV